MKYFCRLVLSTIIFSVTLTDVVFSQELKSYPWGVVYSSDISVQEAKPEIIQLPRLFPQYKNQNRLFKYRNFYVSVVLFPNKTDAINAIKKIGEKYSTGVFKVEIKNWCRSDWTNPKYTKVGIIDCNKVEIASNKTGAIIINMDKPINDPDKAKAMLNKTKGELDKLINAGDSSGFIDIEKDVTIFQKGKYFYIAIINYMNEEYAQKASNNAPPGSIWNNVRTGAIDVKSWCYPKRNVPNKQGYIECKKSN
jgi:hypothetical protein